MSNEELHEWVTRLAVAISRIEHRVWNLERQSGVMVNRVKPDYLNPNPPTQTFDTNPFKGSKL